MKRKNIITSLLAATALTLVGCGGGSGGKTSNDPQTVTGVFQDATVAGLNYICSSGKKEVTNSKGEFTCNTGDTVEFLLGKYSLGSVDTTSGTVTPMSLYPDNAQATTNVLQLLQTLDSGEDGTITIPDGYAALDTVTTTPKDADFDTIMESELGETLVTEEAAQTHMLKTLLAGNTLYTTIYDKMGTMESWSFNADLTNATWQELVGGSHTGSGTVSLDGMTITFTGSDETSVITIKEIKEDYLVAEVTGEDGTETLRIYYDKTKAKAYLLKTLLAGNTLYTTIYDKMGTMESWSFNADLTNATWQELVGGSHTGSGTVSLDGMTITFTGSDETSVITIKEIKEDYLVAEVTGEDGTETLRIYYDETKARAYLHA